MKANDNPWYLLATINGEPRDLIEHHERIPEEERAKWRLTWNRYYADRVDSKTRDWLIQKKGYSKEELTPFLPDDLPQVEEAFSKRRAAAERRDWLIHEKGYSVEKLTPFSLEELQDVKEVFAVGTTAAKRREVEDAYAKYRDPANKIALSAVALPANDEFIDFSNVEFDRYVAFERYLFVQATFEGATFAAPTSFNNATFSDAINFDRVTFSRRGAQFSDTNFSNEAHFHNATFLGPVYFGQATFGKVALFPGTNFSGSANFVKVSFSDGASFASAGFFEEAIFDGATFSQSPSWFTGGWLSSAMFWSATFHRRATFEKTTFYGQAEFKGATFTGKPTFESATFSGKASFNGATFSVGAIFESATFSGDSADVDFDSAIFSGAAVFTKATFDASSSFRNAEMIDKTSFEAATFKTKPPEFFEAKLHQDTVWRRITWPPPPKNNDEAGRFIDAYARLKLEMNRLQKHEDELDFFALELQSRRVEQGLVRGLPIALYGVLSDYGRSYVWPVVWLFAVAAFGGAMFRHFGALTVGEASGLSAANTFNVFGFRKDFIDLSVITTSPWLEMVAAVQTTFGTILLFLFGLGIRNKFRMK